MLAKTDKGKKIRSYYVKLENINNKILKQQMEQTNQKLIEKDNELQQKEIEHINDIKIKKHNMLIEKFNRKKCVYIVEIEENNLIKIGSSKDVHDRIRGIRNSYVKNAIFLDIFDCDVLYKEIEINILNDKMIKNIYIK